MTDCLTDLRMFLHDWLIYLILQNLSGNMLYSAWLGDSQTVLVNFVVEKLFNIILWRLSR